MAGNPKFVIKKSVNNQYYFVFNAANGVTITSTETYTEKHNCVNAIELLKKEAKDAPIEDETISKKW